MQTKVEVSKQKKIRYTTWKRERRIVDCKMAPRKRCTENFQVYDSFPNEVRTFLHADTWLHVVL